MIEAIINEHRMIQGGDFLITLHMPTEAPEEYRNETRMHFAEVLGEKGDIEVILSNTLWQEGMLDRNSYA
eukprot:4343880-Prorocentrum_lima.AAC.1